MTSNEATLDMQVRDYECDYIGIVNNAVYFNYLEHARHEFFKHHLSINFTDLADRNINLVIVQTEARYRSPLRPSDEFTITTRMERGDKPSSIKFLQTIHRKSDNKLCFEATLHGAAMDERGRPIKIDSLVEMVPQLKIIDAE